MRHIGGTYTQRYNRRRKTDGPLFRGRYKSILVDSSEYLLQLSRYIHRNPIETRVPLVENLEDYVYSSYPAYIGIDQAPYWLDMLMTYKMLTCKDKKKSYAEFVHEGNDEETLSFFNKGNQPSVMGSKEFRSWLFEEQLPSLKVEERSRAVYPTIDLTSVAGATADFYQKELSYLVACQMGPQAARPERSVAIYLCQELTQSKLFEIADYFELSSVGSVSHITSKVKKRRKLDSSFDREIKTLIKSIIRNAN